MRRYGKWRNGNVGKGKVSERKEWEGNIRWGKENEGSGREGTNHNAFVRSLKCAKLIVLWGLQAKKIPISRDALGSQILYEANHHHDHHPITNIPRWPPHDHHPKPKTEKPTEKPRLTAREERKPIAYLWDEMVSFGCVRLHRRPHHLRQLMDLKVAVNWTLIRRPTNRKMDTRVVSGRRQVVRNPVEEEDWDVTWRQVLYEAVEVTTDPSNVHEKVKVSNLVNDESTIKF